MCGKLFPIKDLWMINSCLANSPSVDILHSYTRLFTSSGLNECLFGPFKTAAPQNVTDKK